MAALDEVPFLKGHGTGNDFLVLPDPTDSLELTSDRVRLLCDRRFGLGADGILRAVRSDTGSQWFMDYRNADGSIAEMCGNGARVFARYLIDSGQESGSFEIGTRSGTHRVEQHHDATISVAMGKPVPGPTGPAPVVRVGQSEWTGTAWWIPNPHVVAFVDDLTDAGPLSEPPIVEAGARFPDGQNVEFVVDASTHSELAARMRVFERGVGETLSCGTGACAAALALRQRRGVAACGNVSVQVPGGQLNVRFDDDGTVWLRGSAVLVARGVISASWLKEDG